MRGNLDLTESTGLRVSQTEQCIIDYRHFNVSRAKSAHDGDCSER